jgi:fructokinase
MSQASIVKMNDEEVVKISEMFGYPEQSLESFSRYCAGRFGWEAVCITRGPRGCALLIGEEFIEAPGYAVRIADTVGAGDAFAAAFIHGLSSGWPTRRIADFANRVGALIASRHGALPEWTIAEVESLNPKSEVEEPA